MIIGSGIVTIEMMGMMFQVYQDPRTAPDDNSRMVSAIMMALAGIDQRLREVEALALFSVGDLRSSIMQIDAYTLASFDAITARVAEVRKMVNATQPPPSPETS